MYPIDAGLAGMYPNVADMYTADGTDDADGGTNGADASAFGWW